MLVFRFFMLIAYELRVTNYEHTNNFYFIFHISNMVLPFNFLAVLVAAVVPTVVGLLWYSPMLFGTAWRINSGQSEERLRSTNVAIFLIASLLLSFFVSVTLVSNTIHQMGVFGTLANEPKDVMEKVYNDFMATYGDRFRSFGHGALHGTMLGLFGFLPMFALITMRERRGAKYLFIHVGFWVVSLAIMGGIICGWKPA